MTFKSINPTDGTVLATFAELSPSHLEEKLERANAGFKQWRRSSFDERADVLRKTAEILVAEKDAWGRLMTLEMGKPLKQAVAEVEKSALTCGYFADNGASILADQPIATETDSKLRYLPLGTILAVMPWNFPFWQVFRCLAPAVMAGNAVALKHASNVPQCALSIEEIMARAGLPEGVFSTLLISSSKVADVICDPRIAAVTLTGSEGAGASVGAAAGAALKKCVLELGGNDPFVVLPSADIDKAVATGVQARTVNNGQSCVCAKRFIVHRDVYDSFAERFTASMQSLAVGDPMEDATQVGPLANEQGASTIARQVEQSIAAGAHALTGGLPESRNGNFYAPSVLENISPGMPAYQEELFGPVAVLMRAEDFNHAIELANDTPYGLGSSIWTCDPEEQQRCMNEIEAGLTFFNAMVASDPRLPFGGIKQSGYGRELGELGAREFTNVKTIVTAS